MYGQDRKLRSMDTLPCLSVCVEQNGIGLYPSYEAGRPSFGNRTIGVLIDHSGLHACRLQQRIQRRDRVSRPTLRRIGEDDPLFRARKSHEKSGGGLRSVLRVAPPGRIVQADEDDRVVLQPFALV